MDTIKRLQVVDRRDFLAGAGTAAAVLALMRDLALAQDAPAKALSLFDQAFQKIVGNAKPVEGKLDFDLPEIAENGNTVPFSLAVDSPMTDKEHVRTIHVLSTANPQPGVGSFHFTPASGRAAVSSRMRLARTQSVVAVAELNDGRFLIGRRTVKVTIGGCGG